MKGRVYQLRIVCTFCCLYCSADPFKAPPCVLDVDIIQIDSSSEESACSDPDVVGAFQQSLTASYLEKFFYDRVKLQFTARPANGNVTLDEAVRSIANACYGSIKDPKLGCSVNF